MVWFAEIEFCGRKMSYSYELSELHFKKGY